MRILPSRFPLVPLVALCLAAFCLGAPIRADKRFGTGQTGSSGGPEEKVRAQVMPEPTAAVFPEDREVLKLAEAQEKLGLWYEARRTLANAARASRDLELLRRRAAVEDQYGERAGSAYRQLVEACEESVPRPADYADLLERGLFVSIRDGDMKQGEWFSVRLRLAGHGEFAAQFHGRGPASSDEALVPGGTKAALRLAGGQETARREDFLLAFCRCVDNFDPIAAAVFRDLFNSFLQTKSGIQSRRQGMAILDFPARLPISPDGRVVFPGSSKIWMGAALKSRTNRDPGGSLPDRLRSTSPEVEDEILLRLAKSRSRNEQRDLSQLAGLLAIAWVDSHRKVPLDEASAGLLAQEFARLQWVWPYLASLTGLGSEDLSTLVRLERRLREFDTLIRNDALGEWDALAKIINLLAESGNLTPEKAAQFFRSLCERFLLASSPADLSTASLETIRELLTAASAETARPDDAIRDLLLGEPERIALPIGRQTLAVGAADTRRRDYQEVLNLQKVTSLQTLFALYRAARQIRLEPAAAAEWIGVLEENISGLQQVDFSSFPGVSDKTRDMLRSFQASAGIRAIQGMKRTLSTQAPDPGKLVALAEELMASLNPQVRLALTGILYARYLSPKDALVAHDPLFLRKHRFTWLDFLREDAAFPIGELISGQHSGSYIQGGFADFGETAGEITMAALPEVEENVRPAGAVVLGSLRDTHWQSLHDSDLRWVGLKIRVAREWIVRAAFDESRREELRRATLGLLSPGRRRDLFLALESQDWNTLWRQVTLSDLYFLCDAYLQTENRDANVSPTVRALRTFQPTMGSNHLRWLGQDLQPLLGCSHPHLIQLPPYEHYEQSFFPSRLAARAGDYKLHLAEFFDRHGLPASLLGVVAEPLAIELLTHLHLSDPWDWQSLQEAFHGINLELLNRVLKSQ